MYSKCSSFFLIASSMASTHTFAYGGQAYWWCPARSQQWMLTQGMWIWLGCCIRANHVDSLSDWAWTSHFECKMAGDGICVVAQWDLANCHHMNFAWNISAIHIQLTNKPLRALIVPSERCNNQNMSNNFLLFIYFYALIFCGFS